MKNPKQPNPDACSACGGKGWIKRPQLSVFIPHQLRTVKRVCWLCGGHGSSKEAAKLPVTAWRPNNVCRTPAKPTDGPVYKNTFEPWKSMPPWPEQPEIQTVTMNGTHFTRRPGEPVVAERFQALPEQSVVKLGNEVMAGEAMAGSYTFGQLSVGDKFARVATDSYTPYEKVAHHEKSGEALWRASAGRKLKLNEMIFKLDHSTPVYNVVHKQPDEEQIESITRSIYVIGNTLKGEAFPVCGDPGMKHSKLIEGYVDFKPAWAGVATFWPGGCITVGECVNDLDLKPGPLDRDILRRFYRPELLEERKAEVAATEFSSLGPKAPWNKGRKQLKTIAKFEQDSAKANYVVGPRKRKKK